MSRQIQLSVRCVARAGLTHPLGEPRAPACPQCLSEGWTGGLAIAAMSPLLASQPYGRLGRLILHWGVFWFPAAGLAEASGPVPLGEWVLTASTPAPA